MFFNVFTFLGATPDPYHPEELVNVYINDIVRDNSDTTMDYSDSDIVRGHSDTPCYKGADKVTHLPSEA